MTGLMNLQRSDVEGLNWSLNKIHCACICDAWFGGNKMSKRWQKHLVSALTCFRERIGFNSKNHTSLWWNWRQIEPSHSSTAGGDICKCIVGCYRPNYRRETTTKIRKLYNSDVPVMKLNQPDGRHVIGFKLANSLSASKPPAASGSCSWRS